MWLFALGGLFVFVTLFLPKGILGTITDGWSRTHAALPVRRFGAGARGGRTQRGGVRP